jgi:hypothetical protein
MPCLSGRLLTTTPRGAVTASAATLLSIIIRLILIVILIRLGIYCPS